MSTITSSPRGVPFYTANVIILAIDTNESAVHPETRTEWLRP